ncbi:MAG: SIR2 family protein [Planctomycetales bacterium]|nr:SIR2 family protein [Planctomycetales bacterium]
MAKKKATPKAKQSPAIAIQPAGDDHTDEFASLRNPELTEVLTELRDHLSRSRKVFLFGAGCSKCAGLPLMPELTSQVLAHLESQGLTNTHGLLADVEKHFDGAHQPNIEDFMSEIVDFSCIADRRRGRKAAKSSVQIGSAEYEAEKLQQALIEIKSSIAHVIQDVDAEIQWHRVFCNAIHRIGSSGKPGRGTAVDYFTLNYDTLIEDALSLEKLSVCDGFHGGATGWWNADLYNTETADARVFKVHGSIDWCLGEGETLPSRLRHGMQLPGDHERVLIWPAATKYRETQRDPYAQIIDYMRRSLRPPGSDETLLVICGYAFGDSHINLEIERALRESNERLTVMIFTSDDEPADCLRKWQDLAEIRDQVQVYCNKGFFHAEREIRTTEALPWWRFEIFAQILAGAL